MDVLGHRAPWYVAGPLIGVLIVTLRALVNKPLGALGGYIDLAEQGLKPSRWEFRSYLLLGFVLGGFLFAMLTGHFAASLSFGRLDRAFAQLPTELAALVGAGAIMGFGARMAGGCTSGHGMCGMSLGSPASLVATATFFATAVVGAHLLSFLGIS
jgi:uncharacterized membrane protein YedE/YeeE